MIKDLGIVKFDFCFYTIEDYHMHIFKEGIDTKEDLYEYLESDNEFNTFLININ